MAILGYQTNFSRMNLETFQNFALFRYFLIPFAIFLTVVPTGIFSLIQQYQQNQSVLTYTTIISQEDYTANGDNSGAGIVLTPNLTLSGDFICVTCAWIITWIGICGFLRKNNLIGQFISAFLIAFTVLQTLSAIYTVIFSDQWILEILSGSWKKAYLFDSEIIKESQCEFSCKEFVSADDGQKNIPYQPNQFDGCCSKTLMNRFGTQLFDVAKIMLLARFVQLFGVLLHIHIFNRVILDDMKTMYAEEYDSEYYYDDKEYYNDDYISSDELEFEEFEEFEDVEDDDDQYDQYEYDEYDDQYDDQDSWIDSPTSSLLLSKIYFGEQTS